MKVGHLIRAERIRQKMKQVVLAREICTPSYLSKIERNLISPSEEVVTLLFNKLGINIEMLQENDPKTEREFERILKESYKEVITKRNDSFTQQKLDEFEKQSTLFENHSLYYTYLLIVLRFRLILGGDLDERKIEIESMNELSEYFTPNQVYLFNVNKATYYYSIKNRRKAIEYLEDVLPIVDDISLEEWEKAELNYMIGLMYTADNRIFISVEYIRKALDFFREHFQMNRVLDCYVLIGVTQKRSEQFQEAYESYFRAKQLCEDFNLNSEKGLVYHNLGSLYSTMGKSPEAINYLKKSIKYKKDKSSQLISMLGIIIENSKNNDKKLVIEWCNKGISLFVELKNESLTPYYHHFTFYKTLHSEEDTSKERAIEAIEYFKTIQDYQHVHKYCIGIAEWYYSIRKYKLSSIYFKEANRYGYIYRKIENWEVL